MENKPQSERAHELVEFVRGYTISNAPSFSAYAKSRYKDSSWQCAYEHLADEIESLAKPDSLPYPLDKDGIPIKLGETVYRADGKKPFEYQIYNNCEYGMTVETISLHIDRKEITCDYYGCHVCFEPEQLIHSNQRTLDDILQDAEASVYYAKDTGNTVDELIKEAYELGKKEAYEMGKAAKDE